MISFYPGPSQVYKSVPKLVKQAYREGVLGLNHRSEAFMQLYEQTVTLLQEKLYVPANYTVLFTSSATECWEIIAQSLTQRGSTHLYNGAFGKKWMDLAGKIVPRVEAFQFAPEASIEPASFSNDNSDVICITQNETSNGTQVSTEILTKIRQQNRSQLIAVDATSSMAGVVLNFSSADVWFASVQKCFGLPAGLGVMICSPKAMKKAKAVGHQQHYNSLTAMQKMAAIHQTTHTPNVMDIFLLKGILEQSRPVDEQEKVLRKRMNQWRKFIAARSSLKPYIQNQQVTSTTVMTVSAAKATIGEVKSYCLDNGYVLGNGYGQLQDSTFRIANFPAHRDKHIKQLQKLLKRW